MRGEEREFLVGIAVVDDQRRREIARQRRHWQLRHVDEAERAGRLGEVEYARGGAGGGFAIELQRQVVAVGTDQAEGERNMERQLAALARRGRAGLGEREFEHAAGFVVARAHCNARRAGLRVPARELGEVAPVGVGHRGNEVVAGHGLAVVSLKVQVDALAEALAPEQRVQHAHHLRALLVHGGGVEVADLLVRVRPNRVRHRPGVFRELRRAQRAHVFNALDATRPGCLPGAVRAGGAEVSLRHVGGELLVAEHGEPFLQAQLEPVATGDAVARPVVEVLVADDRFDVGVVAVGGHQRIGENVLRVEDVQTLVLHRPHVEVVGGDDHEAVQIEFETKALLVPADGAHEARHRMLGLVELARFDPHLQQHLTAGAGDELFLAADEATGHQGEQVARLGKRVEPTRPMAAVGQLALRGQVAVGQQHRKARSVGAQGDGVGRHHIGPVSEIRNTAEALGLALCEKVAVRYVQPHQFAVDAGRDGVANGQREAVAARGQLKPVGQDLVGGRCQRAAVDVDAEQFEVLAVEHQRPVGPCAVAGDDAGGSNERALGRQIELQRNRLDQPRGRLVVGAPDGDDIVVSHASGTFDGCWIGAASGGLWRASNEIHR